MGGSLLQRKEPDVHLSRKEISIVYGKPAYVAPRRPFVVRHLRKTTFRRVRQMAQSHNRETSHKARVSLLMCGDD